MMTLKRNIQEDRKKPLQEEDITKMYPHWKLTSQKHSLAERQAEELTGR